MPVIAHYKELDKVAHIDTNRAVDVIYGDVKAAMAGIAKK